MHTRNADGGVVPCYIGKSETVGKTAGVPSANLTRLATDTSKFGRWDDNYAYHIGDLSSIVLSGHGLAVQTEKYRSWATALFESVNTDRPRLRQPVFFWVRAWKKEDLSWLGRVQFLRHIRELGPIAGGNYPVIAITALGRRSHRRRALEAGFQEHLSKRFSPDQLVRAVLSVLIL